MNKDEKVREILDTMCSKCKRNIEGFSTIDCRCKVYYQALSKLNSLYPTEAQIGCLATLARMKDKPDVEKIRMALIKNMWFIVEWNERKSGKDRSDLVRKLAKAIANSDIMK